MNRSIGGLGKRHHNVYGIQRRGVDELNGKGKEGKGKERNRYTKPVNTEINDVDESKARRANTTKRKNGDVCGAREVRRGKGNETRRDEDGVEREGNLRCNRNRNRRDGDGSGDEEAR